MKLLTKSLEKQLQKQFPMGSSFDQKVIAKIFNPYGSGTWYLINQDPEDPDYLWAVVLLYNDIGPEMGSVSLNELETLKIKPFGFKLERDLYFNQMTVKELWDKLNEGKHV